jgi:hypothetical protein
MEFILLMDRIKCWLNTPSQVLTLAPALHSLVVHDNYTEKKILKFEFHKNIDLRKLILKNCWFGEPGIDILAHFMDLCPDLEGLLLESCKPLTFESQRQISRLNKLSELNLSYCEVDYVYVKLLGTRVCICEHM